MEPEPPLEVPEAFSATGTALLQARWWESFNDPALCDLVDRALEGNFSLLVAWDRYWLFCVILGAVSGLLYFAVGGWWYRVRLKWSGANQPDPGLARRVYLFASQVHAIPALIYTVWETGHYESPAAAWEGDDWGGVALIVFLFWSVYASYRGVRTVFTISSCPETT